MTRDVIDINDFTILVETSTTDATAIDACAFDEPVIGIAFYGSGNVHLDVEYHSTVKGYEHTKGFALSFYADQDVVFKHMVSKDTPLECLVVVTAVSKLQNLPHQEGEIFAETLNQLVHPTDHYVEGPAFFMTPQMIETVNGIFNNTYSGKTKMMFFRSQVTSILSQFFGHVSSMSTNSIKDVERQKLLQAQDILLNNLDDPPSLNELAMTIGLNSFKLKKSFKEMFGLPVFKYLQTERLNRAHELIRGGDLNIQEVAWEVGYDSLSSFSNAFSKKFGIRPSQIR